MCRPVGSPWNENKKLPQKSLAEPRPPRACCPMNRSASKLRGLARRLIACEAGGNKAAGKKLPAAWLVVEKLRPYFTTLMGNAGFRALLARALALAAGEVPWLGAVQVQADGSLAGFEGLEPVDPADLAEGGVVLIAQLLGLLVAFIGENLTLQMMREIWPKLSLNDLNLNEGDKK